jgi:hypothetical protein
MPFQHGLAGGATILPKAIALAAIATGASAV